MKATKTSSGWRGWEGSTSSPVERHRWRERKEGRALERDLLKEKGWQGGRVGGWEWGG